MNWVWAYGDTCHLNVFFYFVIKVVTEEGPGVTYDGNKCDLGYHNVDQGRALGYLLMYV